MINKRKHNKVASRDLESVKKTQARWFSNRGNFAETVEKSNLFD